jgi:hypothetical protein
MMRLVGRFIRIAAPAVSPAILKNALDIGIVLER